MVITLFCFQGEDDICDFSEKIWRITLKTVIINVKMQISGSPQLPGSSEVNFVFLFDWK